MKDSASEFKFYASGRRHCSSLLATLELRKRQDLLLGYALAPLLPHEERIDMQVSPRESECLGPAQRSRAMHSSISSLGSLLCCRFCWERSHMHPHMAACEPNEASGQV